MSTSENLKIYGIHSVIEAILSDKTLEKVFIKKGLNNPRLNTLLSKHQIAYTYVPEEKLNRLSKNSNHQGVVAHISPIPILSIEELVVQTIDANPVYLILDQLTDVRNFGAIARTAECTNIAGIIIQNQGSAPINADAIKTSAGALYKLPVCKVNHIKDAIYYLQASGVKIIAATEKTEQLVYDVKLTEKIAIVMGSEGKGISSSVLQIVDEKIKLPMAGKIASLNVSVACSVVIYEVVRQRLKS
jgi:23S rRNA (guanosine2251-2'-O)-methyltransferase